MDEGDAGSGGSVLLDSLVKHGWNATSFQTLEPGLTYFSEERGFVAYFDTGAAWVAAGAPIAAPSDIPALTQSFVRAAARAGRRVRFFAVEQRLLALCPELHAIPIGTQPTWNPTRWQQGLSKAPRLREQLRRARAKGVLVRQASPQEIEERLQPAIRRLVERWNGTKQMPPMGFMVELELLVAASERRFFVAERSGVMVGLLALVPVYARRGWLFEDLLRDPEAPNGTTELLLDSAMKTLASQGCEYATLGLAPLAGNVSRWVSTLGRMGSSLFGFAGLHAFKQRLRPQGWTPIYLAYPSDERELVPVFDSLCAFARGRPITFLLRTLRRAPAPLLNMLWALLVPWIIALMVASPCWFPHELIKWLWIGFDVAMVLGLRMLARRWSAGSASLLASAATADAILTALQFALFNASQLKGPLQLSIAAVAMAAPAFASILLWSSVWERGGTAPLRSAAWTHRESAHRSRPVGEVV